MIGSWDAAFPAPFGVARALLNDAHDRHFRSPHHVIPASDLRRLGCARPCVVRIAVGPGDRGGNAGCEWRRRRGAFPRCPAGGAGRMAEHGRANHRDPGAIVGRGSLGIRAARG
jgi:hypothetical protein